MTDIGDRDWFRVKQLLGSALELEPAERPKFLAEGCDGDEALRCEVEELLAATEETRGFMEQPAVAVSLFEGSGPELQPGDQVGPYTILEAIGEGGFSLVYGAQQEAPIRRRVAVKLIKPGMDSRQVMQRFAAEREALSVMDHPNIARVLDAGETVQGRPYVVMEWVDGLPFSEYCDTHRLGIRERIELTLQACAALEHAHQKGVVHRDVKPSNVLVENRNGEHVVKVIDFGIAKALQTAGGDDSVVTQTGMILGTPEYMSPEQAGMNGADVDTRTDVYALGVLLYEALTGVRPFARELVQKAALDEVIRLIREVDPPRPSTRREAATKQAAELRQVRPEELSRSLRGDLDWIVMKALQKDRANRYPSVSGFAEDLRRHLNHEPVTAGPPRLSYRVGKLARRHRAVFAGASIGLLAIVVGAGAAGIGFVKARAAEAQQREARRNAEASLQEAESASTFLADLLSSSRADEMGRDVRVRDVLDRADFADLDSPRVEARIRGVVGNAYRSLGVLDRAAIELEKAHAIVLAEVGPDDARTIKLEHNLLLVRMDRTKEAGLIEEAAKLAQRAARALGEEDPTTFEVRASQASFLVMRRRLDEGIELLLELLPGFERVIGRQTGTTLSLLGNLALAYGMQRDFANAEKYARIHYQRALLDRHPDHPRALFGARSLAVTLLQQGKWQECLEVLRPLVKRMRRVFGADHIHTLGVENYVGFTLQKSGQFDAAKKLYERIVPLQDKVLGRGHRQSMMAVHNLAMMLFSLERWVEAETLLRDALARFDEHRGPRHFETATARFHLGDLLSHRQRFAAALELLTPALQHLVAAVGWKHPITGEAGTAKVRTLNHLAQKKYRAGDKRAAVEIVGEAWLLAADLDQPKSRQQLAKRLAEIYQELGDTEAEALWRQRAGQ